MKITLQERFENFVQPRDDGCWYWMGAKQGAYGVISIAGKNQLAHRVSLKIYNNEDVPADLCVRHKCRTKTCVNPAHLETGTRAQNQADRVRDGTAGGRRLWIKPAANLNTEPT